MSGNNTSDHSVGSFGQSKIPYGQSTQYGSVFWRILLCRAAETILCRPFWVNTMLFQWGGKNRFPPRWLRPHSYDTTPTKSISAKTHHVHEFLLKLQRSVKLINLEAFVNFKITFYHVNYLYTACYLHMCGTEGRGTRSHRSRVCWPYHTWKHMSWTQCSKENAGKYDRHDNTRLYCSIHTAVQLRMTNAASMKAQCGHALLLLCIRTASALHTPPLTLRCETGITVFLL